MTEPPSRRRSLVGAADLLRALAAGPCAYLELESDKDVWFGYWPKPKTEIVPEIPAEKGRVVTTGAPDSAPRRRVPLRMQSLHMVASRESRAPLPPAEPRAPVEPLGPESGAPRFERRRGGFEDLVPWARLMPALRRLLAVPRAGPLDVPSLTRALADQALPPRLPRLAVSRWHPDLVVVLDFADRLWPYYADLHRLAERLLDQCGHSGISLRVFERGPSGRWSDWAAHQDLNRDSPPAERSWIMPPAGTPILLVSDLGLLLGEEGGAARAWAGFVASLRRARTRPIGLVPLGARQVGRGIAALLPILRWSPDAPIVPARHSGTTAAADGVDDLLAMISMTPRVDPPLLRALRRLNPVAPLNAGLEGAVWGHADIVAGSTARLRDPPPSHRQDYRQRFAQFDSAVQARLIALLDQHHGHLRASLDHEETLTLARHAKPDALNTDMMLGRIKKAEAFLARLPKTLETPQPSPASANASDWWYVARGLADRADAAMSETQRDLFHDLLVPLLAREGDRARVPDWADPARLKARLDDGASGVTCWLVEQAPGAVLRLQASPPGRHQAAVTDALTVDAGGLRLRRPGRPAELLRGGAALAAELGRLEEGGSLEIETTRDRLVVVRVERPYGVLGWGRDGDGIEIVAPPLGQWAQTWRGGALGAVPRQRRGRAVWGVVSALNAAFEPVSGQSGTAAVRFGINPGFGVYADLRVDTKHGQAEQRLRWIEPGSFRMGSPETEAERWDGEGPRHWVTLTRGFWLADTACTQALWRAVTGKDLSHFSGDDALPVESVSWLNVQDFLRVLTSLLPGCVADLPSEAEWEYACRAGTETPFSFGATISPEVVNYNGNYPYAGGAEGLYREKTVPVRSLPANEWGLYEMHGNVYEWCADGLRNYDDAPQENPRGPVDKTSARAGRGGSWYSSVTGARSARRRAYLPGGSDVCLGFRLCLRSIESGPERPGGSAEPAPGGRPPRDVAGFSGLFRARKKTKK